VAPTSEDHEEVASHLLAKKMSCVAAFRTDWSLFSLRAGRPLRETLEALVGLWFGFTPLLDSEPTLSSRLTIKI